MYGCLMKFAVECGRTDLSRDLSEKAPSLDIQNYMSLIRAAGRDHDVDRAFAVLEKLKKSGITLDNAAYNCALDVCASAGQLDRAHELIKEMRSNSTLDIITFNTLLKGHCNAGDLKGAKRLLVDMKEAGLQPNDVSFNCLINAAVSTRNGSFDEAWEIIDLMEKSGVKVDHYTISIMMKSLKKARNHGDVQRALALLDRTEIQVCSDEILLNTVLETCIRHREQARLRQVVAAYRKSDMRPGVHTYGSLIKACSNLKKPDQCREFWREMQEVRGMEPNDIVLGCMLDALVCNGLVNDAVELFNKWKVKIQANTVMYSTIIKGFATSHQSELAMAAWRDMRAEGVQTNTVVYNAVIDAQARVGAIGEVSELVEAMTLDGCTPDAITHSTVAKGYCVKGELDRAFEVFQDMQKCGMAKDAIIYNTLLDGCTRHGRMDLADKVMQAMEANDIVSSNFTLGILVKMYGRRRMLDKAFEVVQELPRKHKFAVNAQVRTCLMCTCINNNALDRALTVFEELKKEQACDAKAYQSLINGCVRHGHLERAQMLVEEACGLGKEPSPLGPGQMLPSDSIEQLLRALAGKGLMERVGNPLLEKLRASKAPVDKKVFSAAIGMQNNRAGGGGGRGGAPWAKK
jgi:pentatricopeptide repeat protein